jgi:hypothetical protein
MNEMLQVRRRLAGDRNQCPGYGEFFNSTHAFDAHRTGAFGKPGEPARRRCMSVAEMQATGMTLNAAGFWITRKSEDRMRRDANTPTVSQNQVDAAPENHRM